MICHCLDRNEVPYRVILLMRKPPNGIQHVRFFFQHANASPLSPHHMLNPIFIRSMYPSLPPSSFSRKQSAPPHGGGGGGGERGNTRVCVWTEGRTGRRRGKVRWKEREREREREDDGCEGKMCEREGERRGDLNARSPFSSPPYMRNTKRACWQMDRNRNPPSNILGQFAGKMPSSAWQGKKIVDISRGFHSTNAGRSEEFGILFFPGPSYKLAAREWEGGYDSPRSL